MENLKKSFLVRGNNIVGFSDKKNFSTAPLGTVLSFAGQARPNGYLLCDGASYKVTDYPDLYAVIGNTYGGDSTNFNVPNLVDASQSPAPTMIYIIKAFHTNEGVDSDAGSGEENKIDSISVNGSPVSIDENKNVDITVPDAYDDTALVKRVSDIESDYATKDEIPTVPSKVSELTNDSNYQTAEQVNSTVTTEIAKVVADAPEDLNTLKEMSDWIAGHEDDASAMNSAISDNKTAITALQTGKADKSEIPTTVAELTDSTDYAKKTDLNNEISRAKEAEEVLKSRIDNITSIPGGSTTGDVELQDIRVKADGTTATSAGNAVREQISKLKSDVNAKVPSILLKGGFQVVAYSEREISGNSKLECLENWITNALSKYISNLVVIGNIYNINYVDGFAIVNVWGSNTEGILGASGILVDQEGVYYYKKQNGASGSGTLTKIN